MHITSFDPLRDERWPAFLERDERSSVFHTRGWLRALQQTYGFEPVAFTTSGSADLRNAVVFCRVSSWITGRRLVSLPFSDHCEPLCDREDLEAILAFLKDQTRRSRYRYVEVRPAKTAMRSASGSGYAEHCEYRLHRIDLEPSVVDLYKSLHDSCIRRKIKRAEREQLVYETGRSERLLGEFLKLHLMTRRKHHLPPQPDHWFESLMECFGPAISIHLAWKGTTAISSMITIEHKRTLTYKYGASHQELQALGGMPFLFWNVIQQAKQSGFVELDLGRSDCDEAGLIAFKEHLGGIAAGLTYYRLGGKARRAAEPGQPGRVKRWARKLVAELPDGVLRQVGSMVYPHIG